MPETDSSSPAAPTDETTPPEAEASIETEIEAAVQDQLSEAISKLLLASFVSASRKLASGELDAAKGEGGVDVGDVPATKEIDSAPVEDKPAAKEENNDDVGNEPAAEEEAAKVQDKPAVEKEDIILVTEAPRAKDPPVSLSPFFRVPHPRNTEFLGRIPALSQLFGMWNPGHTSQARIAIVGLGGIG